MDTLRYYLIPLVTASGVVAFISGAIGSGSVP